MRSASFRNFRRRFTRSALALALGCAVFAGPAVDGGLAQTGALQRFPLDQLDIVTEKGTSTFTVEIARTPRQHSQGLMYRRKLRPDAGMLFLYGSPQVIRMWMKNTFIPLDMIFIAANGRIVSIVERAVPGSVQTVSSEGPASAVLEVNGGTVARLGIGVGDRVRHPAFGTGE